MESWSHVPTTDRTQAARPHCQCVGDSQPPNVALALSAAWQQSVLLATSNYLAPTLPGTVECTQAGCAEAEAAVGAAAHPLPLHRLAPCRMLAPRTRLEALVVEESFSDLKEEQGLFAICLRFL